MSKELTLVERILAPEPTEEEHWLRALALADRCCEVISRDRQPSFAPGVVRPLNGRGDRERE